MAGNLEKVYADALFELAEEQNILDSVCEELVAVSYILSENSEFVKLVQAPTVSADEKKALISAAFENKVCETVFNFINVLSEKGRMKYFTNIAGKFKEMYNEKNNILEVTAVTAAPLSETLRTKLVDKLTKASEKKIVLKEKTDKSIMGGIILNYGNSQMDASVKTRLENMRRQIDSIIA